MLTGRAWVRVWRCEPSDALVLMRTLLVGVGRIWVRRLGEPTVLVGLRAIACANPTPTPAPAGQNILGEGF